MEDTSYCEQIIIKPHPQWNFHECPLSIYICWIELFFVLGY
ncbi:hypothetical protein PHET_00475 [Paragonimus heterotremus]|uniref:Uncharacterized protein n=1 Tax=Paragonimus heterotremus TaxID=100268 RepID=A0A8J4WJU6_9TREM|nr:hypothetical protein PHET_00475 [Paragonimus heterotremus]